MRGAVWYNNLLKGVVNNNQYVGTGIAMIARDMKIYNDTVMFPWPTAGYAFGGTEGDSMQDKCACLMTPSQVERAYYGDSNEGKYHGLCAQPNRWKLCRGIAIAGSYVGTYKQHWRRLDRHCYSIGSRFGTQVVVSAIDGRYVSAVMGPGLILSTIKPQG
jgi:hypothetical protein